MKEIKLIIEEDGVRIDKAISTLLPDYSRSFIQKLIKDNHCLVNDKVVKAKYQVMEDDVVILEIPDPTAVDIPAVDMNLDIVYEDDDLLVVNKPKGMVVHPAPGHYDDTLVNGVLFHCKDSLSGINGELRPGIVHRIDKDTTGLIVVCKNDKAHESIAQQLKDHTVTRTYECIVHQNMKEESGTVDAPVARHSTNRKKMAIDRINGRRAVTHYKVIQRLKNNQFVHIQCQLETGRTHQIRVHMASIRHPLMGDEVYGKGKEKYNLTGQTLHARTLGFIHPTTKEYMEFTSELPEYFQKLIRVLSL